MAMAMASPSRALLLLLVSVVLFTPSSSSSSLSCSGGTTGFCPFDLSAAQPTISSQPLAQAHPRYTPHEPQASLWSRRESLLAVGHYPPKKLDVLRLSALAMPADQIRRSTGSFRVPALRPRRRQAQGGSCQGGEPTSAAHESHLMGGTSMPMSCANSQLS